MPPGQGPGLPMSAAGKGSRESADGRKDVKAPAPPPGCEREKERPSGVLSRPVPLTSRGRRGERLPPTTGSSKVCGRGKEGGQRGLTRSPEFHARGEVGSPEP